MSVAATSTSWEPSEQQFELLFAELGRCVHLYQGIELHLKYVLPHLLVPSTDAHAPGEGFENWRVLLDSKKTLGALVHLLAARVSSDDMPALERAWRRLVDERNSVVHHFSSQPFSGMRSEAEYTDALEFLRARHTSALPMLQMVREIFHMLLAASQEVRDPV